MAETILIVDDEQIVPVLGESSPTGLPSGGDNGRNALPDPAAGISPPRVARHLMPEIDGIELPPNPGAIGYVGNRHPGLGNIETAVARRQLRPFFHREAVRSKGCCSAWSALGRGPGMPGARHRRDRYARFSKGGPHGPDAGRSVVVNGHGLHSGASAGLILHPGRSEPGGVSISADVEIPALSPTSAPRAMPPRCFTTVRRRRRSSTCSPPYTRSASPICGSRCRARFRFSTARP